jgi:threonine dehydratase
VVTLDDIREARRLLEGVALRTPVCDSRTFSSWTGAEVLLKAENLQKTGSFKIRGATNRLAHLTAEERVRGVVAASAGNHAQGIALAAASIGVPATVYMPVDAPLAKQAATRGYGAEVILEGDSFDDAYRAAKAAAVASGRTFVSAFDDEGIVAGQGTLGLEILEDVPEVDLLLVPLGGGGLLAGVATAVKALRPACRIVGVQAAGCASYRRSLDAGAPEPAPEVQTLADGIAVKRPGVVTFPIVQRLVDDVVEVSDEEICSAIVSLLERAKLVVEGAGAVGVAALLSGRVAAEGLTTVCVLSGGNLDAGLLQSVVRYGLTVGGRYLVLRTKISDRPGSLLRLLDLLARDRINIVDVEHHREGMEVGVRDVDVELTVETRDREHVVEVLNALEREGYQTERVL